MALLVIDMQRDFLEDGGYATALGNEVALAQPARDGVATLLSAARAAGVPVIHTRESHDPELRDCSARKRAHGAPGLRIGDAGPLGRILVRGEAGHEFVEEALPLADEVVVEKPGKGAFYATPLEEILAQHGITTLLVCGVTTEVCVQSTVREAADRGLACVVVEDACGSYHPELHRAALAMVRAQNGIFGVTASTAAVCEALAATPVLTEVAR